MNGQFWGLSRTTGAEKTPALSLTEATTGKRLEPTFRKETDGVQVAHDPNQERLVVRYGQGTVRIFDIKSGKMTRLMTSYLPRVSLLSFGPEARYLYAARGSDIAYVWDRLGKTAPQEGSLGELVRPPVFDMAHGTTAVTSSSKDRMVAVGTEYGGVFGYSLDRVLKASDAKGGSSAKEGPWAWRAPQLQSGIQGLAFLRDAEVLVAITAQGELGEFSLSAGAWTRRWRAHPFRASSLAVQKEGAVLATGGHDGVALWETATGKQIRRLGTGTQWVTSVALHQHQLLATTLRGDIWAWDLETGKLRWKVEGHAGWCGPLVPHPELALAATSGEDHFIKLWDLNTGQLLKESQGFGQSLAWSDDGEWLAVNSQATVTVYDRALRKGEGASFLLDLGWADEYT